MTKKSHTAYPPSCDNNVIDNCSFGPNVRAEGIDIKEGTQYTIVKNCTFSASGISNLNSADAFIDVKGGNTFVYNNTFNTDNEPNLASCIDFQQRTGTNSGYRIAIFNNTFNLGSAKSGIPTARKKGGTPSQVHIWSNTRNPSSPDFPISDGTTNFVTQSCPSWNILPCSGGGTGGSTNTPPTASITSPSNGATFTAGANITINATATDNGSVTKVDFYRGTTLLGTDTTEPSYQYTISNASAGSYALKVVATDNNGATTTSATVNITVNAVVVNPPTGGGCNFGTPTSAGLGSFDRITFTKMYKLGSGGPDASNFKNFKINWNLATNSLVQFGYSTNNGIPSYYNDLRSKITQNFSSTSPSVKISNSGISGLDGDYWVTKKGLNLILVTKNGSYTLYFTNETSTPSCSTSREISENNNSPFEFATIYPNPSNGVLNLDGIATESNLLISDLQGKTVLQKTNIKNEKNIDISNLTDGIYIVTFEGNSTTKNLKLIISR
ncbi:MAG: T9SS type A sorting domain-containing protein [Flavobacterium sp.]|nr:T9SS type A sorting domain-containing protein [Flavobacterium sp.]